ncbi:MAG: MBL fold metallo-hydrolase [Cytophagaceae bacterium]|jgi:glyoxylase-like metal-dependent hydrolase (beta-lactamase superfamily II)|nr:MBL fold metallo-hydrolase [Cytophagaceae bacterium]
MSQVEFFTFNDLGENTYLLMDASTKKAAIVDAGCYYPEEVAEVQRTVQRLGLKIEALINTHCHIDHVVGVEALKRLYNVPFLIPEKELPVLASGKVVAAMYGFHAYQEPEYDGFLEGDYFILGNSKFKLLQVPGHSPGHIAFLNEAEAYCIAGDVLFRESVGRTDLPGGNTQQLVTSIQQQLYTLPDSTVVYPGHGPSTTIAWEKKNNPYVRGQ